MSLPITQQTMADLQEVCSFFGIDLEWNAGVFRDAIRQNEAAAVQFIRNLAAAARDDRRYGLAKRMREAADKRRQEKLKAGSSGGANVGRRRIVE